MCSENKMNSKQKWLSVCRNSTRAIYSGHFTKFEKFTHKTADQMLSEHRKFISNPQTADTYPLTIFHFYQALLDGKIKTHYNKTVYSQKAAKTIISAVQSFFNFHNVPIKLKKYTQKDPRMKKPKVQNKKHQLLNHQISALFKIASIRDKCILALGLSGQDESTISQLKIEQFNDKLSCSTLEFIETVRPKTNEDLLIPLTVETQELLKDYLKTLNRNEGWLFQGYQNKEAKKAKIERPIKPTLCNDVFKQLCKQAQIKPQTDKRLTFHCCRMWFSAQLKSKISDDHIDLMLGHAVSNSGAYLGDINKTRQTLLDANILNLLRFQQTFVNNETKKSVSELQRIIKIQQDALQYEVKARLKVENLVERQDLSLKEHAKLIEKLSEQLRELSCK